MNLKALRARLVAIKTEATALVDAADATTGMTEAVQASFDALMTESKTVEANIARLEQLDKMTASAGRAAAPVAPATPAAAPTTFEVGDTVISQDPMRGFSDVAEFGLAVKSAGLGNGRVDDRLLIATPDATAGTNFHRETSSSDGYMVPPQVSDTVTKLVMNDEGLLARTNPEPTNSNMMQLIQDESTPWGTTGIQAYWGGEGDAMTTSRLATTAINVPLHKLYAFVTATDELMEDAPRLQARLTQGAAEAISYKADEALVNGDGVGKPKGWFVGDAKVSQAKVTSQTAATIVAANVLGMRSKLLGNGAGAFWITHSTTLPQLGTMTIGDQPMWLAPSGTLHNAPGGMLLGLPVVISEHCQVLGTVGDIQLVQPKGYHTAIKTGGMKFAMSMHLYFNQDLGAFRWTFRLGGQTKLSAAVTQDNGSGTLAHIVTLATRS